MNGCGVQVPKSSKGAGLFPLPPAGRHFIAGALISALLVSGCASTGGYRQTYGSSSQARLAQLSEAYNQTLAEGCVAGAALGGLAGGLIGRDWKGAVAGLLAGAALGCAAGNYMGNLQNNYAREEDRLNAVIIDIRRDNQSLAELIPVAQRVVEDNKARVAELNQAIAAGRISRAQAAGQLADLDVSRSQLQATLGSAKKRLAEQHAAVAMNTYNANPQLANIAREELARKEQQIQSLESELNTLTQLRSVDRVG
ncbi:MULTISPECIES: glycine zipper 2TM domain-containing protein [Methylococcus]|uniref:Glycine zipper 2TM domain-containing protein n=1 Tax=Methylococcus capsulatus TaxID=414 RepID=A0ABZ2F4B7_METCP|nr:MULTISPECIES: glycine zipper 2TM domain-containing protein [Methylococcus]MDF9392546.1 glycine zipper 2TM domain-containing protein [Methylococcus capsulatus]